MMAAAMSNYMYTPSPLRPLGPSWFDGDIDRHHEYVQRHMKWAKDNPVLAREHAIKGTIPPPAAPVVEAALNDVARELEVEGGNDKAD